MRRYDFIPLCLIAFSSVYMGISTFSLPILKMIMPKPEIQAIKQIQAIPDYKPEHKPTTTEHYGLSVDTIYRGDTVYFYPSKQRNGRLEVIVRADSLSGSTNAIIHYETSDLGLIWKRSGYDWDGESVMVNGSDPCVMQVDDYMYHEKFRVCVVAAQSTQATRVGFKYVLN